MSSACRRRARWSISSSATVQLPGYSTTTMRRNARAMPASPSVAARAERVLRGFKVDEFDREGRYLELQLISCLSSRCICPPAPPDLSARPRSSAFSRRSCRTCDASRARAPRIHPLRRLEYCPQADRSEELEIEPEELGLPARGARLDGSAAGAGKYIDAFRSLVPEAEHYTWWSNRGQAWAKNVGWRIDYQILSPGLAGTPQRAHIHKEPRFSDHAPLIMDYRL